MNHDGSRKALDNLLQKNWTALTRLGIPVGKLLDIVSKRGSGATLDYLKTNWAALSGFTNNSGEAITVDQLAIISNHNFAIKALEVLLNNTRIKEFTMAAISPFTFLKLIHRGLYRFKKVYHFKK